MKRMEEALSVLVVIGVISSVISKFMKVSSKRPTVQKAGFPTFEGKAPETAEGDDARSDRIRPIHWAEAKTVAPERKNAIPASNVPKAKVSVGQLRNAVIMSEILGKPVSLRDK